MENNEERVPSSLDKIPEKKSPVLPSPIKQISTTTARQGNFAFHSITVLLEDGSLWSKTDRGKFYRESLEIAER